MKGRLVTFEGAEGSGKSTQIRLLLKYLQSLKKKSVFVREPGGVVISERIRKLLLDIKSQGMSDECETLLYMAARAQLVKEVIVPELKKGSIIICDRFLDSTLAYQGYGNGVDIEKIKEIGEFVTQGISPSLTVYLDIDVKKGMKRIEKRRKDRIEQRAQSYHNRVREGYKKIAKTESHRIKVIDAEKSKEEVHTLVCNYIDQIL